MQLIKEASLTIMIWVEKNNINIDVYFLELK